MLRPLVLLLVLANVGYYTWSQGWLDGVAGGSQGDREPQRLSMQVRPEIVRILPPSAAASGAGGGVNSAGGNGAANGAGSAASASSQTSSFGASTFASATTSSANTPAPATATTAATASARLADAGVTGARADGAMPGSSGSNASAGAQAACIEAGPFSALQLVAAQSSLRAASVEPVSEVATERPGAWMVYMGRYVNRDAMLRKVEELKRRQLDYEEVEGLPDLQPGLSLGRFDSRRAADEALVQINHRAVRTARVVTVAPPATLHWLRQAGATPARQQQLLALKAPALGEGFAACGTSPAAQAAQAARQPTPAPAPGAPNAASVGSSSS
ncbi:MAG: hypothetical protein JWQ11_3149 [Rhizobacter sp.]|nr:hypothetical protein [Rhizobacter sp.]